MTSLYYFYKERKMQGAWSVVRNRWQIMPEWDLMVLNVSYFIQ